MHKLTILGAAAFVAAAASPAVAQQVIYNPGYCAQYYPNANCQNLGPGNPYTDGYGSYRGGRTAYYGHSSRYRHDAWNRGYDRNGYYRNGYYRSGFWPGDVAGDVIGGAIGTAGAVAAGAVNTAGAIATAPFRAGDSYAYYNAGWNDDGWYGGGWSNGSWGNQSYAERNGFVCTPGTYFKGADGLRYRCQ